MGYSAYELLFSQLAVLPVDLEAGTFLGIDWDDVVTHEELILARVQQLEQHEEVMEKAYAKHPLKPGDLVLAYNKSLESQWGNLFKNHWNGPYWVREQHISGAYILEELDGTLLGRRFAAEHIKRFYP
ncbi:hypothetical protein CROQUDRAFT_101841 [Cronartium quercuum f. sp. fusiforme G11]|uniref:Uncharacterized protein n=1 Tax=Cronartium quercuum f. sp. fusiforme G11 TaxID=708437 RepID=A0A9P6T6C4_9BASI|nr:hypothetical protein CROQUDRAFT_101841 [Cronartium quercuum f. sp. fusiforme G11]